MRISTLLVLDAGINLVLGVFLLIFPRGIVHALGIPDVEHAFYPGILGAVFLGIGIALLLERFQDRIRMRGLGLGGAICINLCGGIVLALWLIAGDLSLPLRGLVLLWGLVVILVGISIFEFFSQRKRYRDA